MRILITNDDGMHAAGLRIAEAIAARFSDDVWVVAPMEEQSGAGHSLTLTRPLRLRRHDDRRFSVSGTPTGENYVLPTGSGSHPGAAQLPHPSMHPFVGDPTNGRSAGQSSTGYPNTPPLNLGTQN